MNQRSMVFRRIPYEIFILLLTFLSLLNGVTLFFWSDENWASVVWNIDVLISILLLLDFASLLYRAPDKSHYFLRGWGWADFLGSLPIPGLRLLRLIRLVAVSRYLHAEGIFGLKRGFRRQLTESTLLFVAFGLILLLEIGCILVLNAEEGAENANILTGGDAMWWGVVTVATVGYGDRFPVTSSGRVIGILIMLAGVALVAVFTAYIANSFFQRQERGQVSDESDDELRSEIAKLHQMIEELQSSINKLSGG